MTAVARYRCRRCGREFTAWAPAEAHADSDRHCRVELVIQPEQKEPDMSPKQSIRKDRRQGEKRMGPPPVAAKGGGQAEPDTSPPGVPPATQPRR